MNSFDCNLADFIQSTTELDLRPSISKYDDNGASHKADYNSGSDLKVDIEQGSTVSNLCEDRIRSGESLFKMFLFEPSQHRDETEKCIAFWKYLRTRTDIKPVACNLTKEPSKNKTNNKKKKSQEVQTDITALPKRLTPENCPWTLTWERINEIKKSQYNTCTTRKTFCKLCDDEVRGVDSSSISSGQSITKSDIIALNKWDPFAKEYVDIGVDYPYSDIFSDKANDVITIEEMEKGPGSSQKVLESSYKPFQNLSFKPIGKQPNKLVNTICTIPIDEDEETINIGLYNFGSEEKRRVSFFDTVIKTSSSAASKISRGSAGFQRSSILGSKTSKVSVDSKRLSVADKSGRVSVDSKRLSVADKSGRVSVDSKRLSVADKSGRVSVDSKRLSVADKSCKASVERKSRLSSFTSNTSSAADTSLNTQKAKSLTTLLEPSSNAKKKPATSDETQTSCSSEEMVLFNTGCLICGYTNCKCQN